MSVRNQWTKALLLVTVIIALGTYIYAPRLRAKAQSKRLNKSLSPDGQALSPFMPVGQLHLASNPAGIEIIELARSWDEKPAGEGNLDGPTGWVDSPDMANYGVPADAAAVLIQTKVKVMTKTWSTEACDGLVQVAFRSPDDSTPTNGVNFARASKPANFGANTELGGLTTETTNYSLSPVRVVSGKFQIFTEFSITNNVLIERNVMLVGYYGND